MIAKNYGRIEQVVQAELSKELRSAGLKDSAVAEVVDVTLFHIKRTLASNRHEMALEAFNINPDELLQQ